MDTCWTMIRAAAEGDRAARSGFARSYLPVVRAYLRARWKASPLRDEIDDAVQNVFVECFRTNGAIHKADATHSGGFQVFLRGVTQNVAARIERERVQRLARTSREEFEPDQVRASDTSLGKVFDRAYARRIMEEAAAKQRETAHEKGAVAERRVRILQLRFEDGLPIRKIAAKLGMEAASVHREYATARKEFRSALREVVLFHQPEAKLRLNRECRKLLELVT